MGKILKKAILPMDYDNYVFDLYGTLVDIHTEESEHQLWEKLALFYGYYGALYEPEELEKNYHRLVKEKESALKMTLDSDPHYVHESSPEIDIAEVFADLYKDKGADADENLVVHTGQFFRVLSTYYVRCYPGTAKMLQGLKAAGKKVYLLSNAQSIFTAYEIRSLDIFKYFDDILISSDYKTKKPDERFFRTLIDRHDLDVSKSIYVGNDSKNDVEGARAVQMATFYVQSNISPKDDWSDVADYAVKDFTCWE